MQSCLFQLKGDKKDKKEKKPQKIEDFIKDAVKVHNKLRKKHGVRSSYGYTQEVSHFSVKEDLNS